MKSSTLEPPRPFVYTPPILDIFVIWHPKDTEGSLIYNALLKHYHSKTFAGLAENAIEVYGRTSSNVLNNNTNTTILPIFTTDGTIGPDHINYTKDIAKHSTILVFIGEHLVRSSLQTGNEWHSYLSDVLKIQHRSSRENSRTLILPILPTHLPDYSNSPIISKLLDRQGISQGNVGLLKNSIGRLPAASNGELMRDLGQAIIQNLLIRSNQQKRLQIFVSHSRSDIPKDDLNDIYPQGVAAKVRAWADKTKLGHFFHDLQPGDPWDESIRQQVRNGALLMVRTEQYSRREWTQWEVLEAKRSNTPIVCLDAATETQQGSFIFDNVPRITYPTADKALKSETLNDLQAHAIIKAFNLLVDISLKHKLWNHQFAQPHSSTPWKTIILPHPQGNADRETHFFISTSQPPEPTLIPSLLDGPSSNSRENKHVWIIHPDPPIFPAEHDAIVDCASLAGFDRQNIHVTTPRTVAFETVSTEGKSSPGYDRNSVLNSLHNVTLGISASYGEDMPYFGLQPQHLELVMSKIAQAMVVCGGKFTYAGGQLVNSPNLALRLLRETKQVFTQIRLQQNRSGSLRGNVVPHSPTAAFRLTPLFSCILDVEALDEIASLSRDIASYGEINIVGTDENTDDGYESTLHTKTHRLSAHRESLPMYCNARLAISGKMNPASIVNPNGYQGVMPGIIEESLYTLRAGQPLFIAGGFGGAAAVLSDIVNKTDIYSGQPHLIKSAYDQHKDTLEEIEYLYNPLSTGLDAGDIHRLATTRRPYEVARLVIKGLTTG